MNSENGAERDAEDGFPGDLIRARREAKGWNQDELAMRIGARSGRKLIIQWEKGYGAPGPRMARALARELGGEAEEYRKPRLDLLQRLERLEGDAVQARRDIAALRREIHEATQRLREPEVREAQSGP